MERVILVVLVLAGVTVHGDSMLQVPSPVMDFILGCERNLRAPKIPVARTAVDPATGTETEEVKLMDLGLLRTSLGKSFESGSMVEHIISEIENSLTEQEAKTGRHACTQVTISVPPQEVKDLDGQLQSVVQQNNHQLLSQINTLFTFKMNKLLEDIKVAIAANTAAVVEPIVSSAEALPSADKATLAENIQVVSKKVVKTVAREAELVPQDAPAKPTVADTTAAKETPVLVIAEESPKSQPDEAPEEAPTVSQEAVLPKRRIALKRRVPNPKLAPAPIEVEEEPIPEQPAAEVKSTANIAEVKPTTNIADARKRRLTDMMALRRQFLSRRRHTQ